MAVEAYNLIPRRTPKTKRVVKNSFVAIVPDATFLGDAVQKIAASEIKAQMKIGNNPKNLIIDNKDYKPFNQAEFRVTALFTDARIIAMAAFQVIKELRSVTRKLSGLARSSFEIWTVEDYSDPGRYRVNAQNASINTLEKLANTLPPTGRIVIAGPMTDYGRKLYWNPLS